MAATKDVRISDPYVLAEIERVRVASGDKTSTKTATRLILQQVTLMDMGRLVRTQPISVVHDTRHGGAVHAIAG